MSIQIQLIAWTKNIQPLIEKYGYMLLLLLHRKQVLGILFCLALFSRWNFPTIAKKRCSNKNKFSYFLRPIEFEFSFDKHWNKWTVLKFEIFFALALFLKSKIHSFVCTPNKICQHQKQKHYIYLLLNF